MGAKQGIEIRTHGEHYYRTEKEKGIKKFEKTVYVRSLDIFNETARKYTGTDGNGLPTFRESSFMNIRGVLKKRLLPMILRRDIVEFARVRFVVIDEVIQHSGSIIDLPVTLRSKKQLAELIASEKLPINPDEYVDIDELRTDVLDCQTDPKTFAADLPRRQKRRDEERAFMEMNNFAADTTLPPPTRPRRGIAATQEL